MTIKHYSFVVFLLLLFSSYFARGGDVDGIVVDFAALDPRSDVTGRLESGNFEIILKADNGKSICLPYIIAKDMTPQGVARSIARGTNGSGWVAELDKGKARIRFRGRRLDGVFVPVTGVEIVAPKLQEGRRPKVLPKESSMF